MNYYGYEVIRESDISHYGILGQKWGIRRYQNKDGSLTAAGEKRYSDSPSKNTLAYYNGRKNRYSDWENDPNPVIIGYSNADIKLGYKARNDKDKAWARFNRLYPGVNRSFQEYNDAVKTASQLDSQMRLMRGSSYYSEEDLEELKKKLEEAEKDAESKKQHYDDLVTEYKKYAHEAFVAQKAYDKTPLGALEAAKNTINKGINFVKRIVNNIKKK